MAVLRIRDPVHPGSMNEKIQIQVPGSRIRSQIPDPQHWFDGKIQIQILIRNRTRYLRGRPKNVRIWNTNTNSSMICNTVPGTCNGFQPVIVLAIKENLRHRTPVCRQKRSAVKQRWNRYRLGSYQSKIHRYTLCSTNTGNFRILN